MPETTTTSHNRIRLSFILMGLAAILVVGVVIFIIWRIIAFVVRPLSPDTKIGSVDDVETRSVSQFNFDDSELRVLGVTDETVEIDLVEPFDPHPTLAVLNEFPERYIGRGVTMQGRIFEQLDEEFFVLQEPGSNDQILLLIQSPEERGQVILNQSTTILGTVKITRAALVPYPDIQNLLPKPQSNLLIIDVSDVIP